MNIKLEPCRFCGEDLQLQYIRVDAKDSDRDIIKCRMCKSQAPLKFWNRSESAKKNDQGVVEFDQKEFTERAKRMFKNMLFCLNIKEADTAEKQHEINRIIDAHAEVICQRFGSPVREPISEEKILICMKSVQVPAHPLESDYDKHERWLEATAKAIADYLKTREDK